MEQIYYFNFSKGFSGSNYYNTLPTAPFIKTLEADKRRCIILEIGPERALFISNYYDAFFVARFKTPGLMFRHGDRSQVSQMKVTDG